MVLPRLKGMTEPHFLDHKAAVEYLLHAPVTAEEESAAAKLNIGPRTARASRWIEDAMNHLRSENKRLAGFNGVINLTASAILREQGLRGKLPTRVGVLRRWEDLDRMPVLIGEILRGVAELSGEPAPETGPETYWEK
ncbi:hypothetical protein CENDO_00095 [Corynebacterium endometrii]|uniref:Uncharacterized protein n=2 Tax=Corynebacterium endometrii TaxID=2488819 RepID=A0A4P7QDK1_9CORY|nr:hypothetical protein CENDO_00095 [Corynebacterium endometrii]